MKKTLPLISSLLLLATTITIQSFGPRSPVQTVLAQGDLSVIGWNSSVNRGVAFVTWVNLATGTEIRFTDNGFNSDGTIRWQETVLIWTATSAVAAGSVVTIEDETANTGTANAINSNGLDPSVTAIGLSNNGGDQVFAYQGVNMPTATTPVVGNSQTFNNTLLFGLGFRGNSSNTTWLATGTTGTATSYLPGTLVSPNRIYLGGAGETAGQYSGPRSGSTTAASYKTLIENPANWTNVTGLGPVVTYNTGSFSLGTPPSITSQPGSASICAGTNTSFSITASNASSYQWYVNTGSGFTSISNGGVYSGATTATLTITSATAGMSGYTYRCTAVGSITPDAVSNTVTLTVNAAPSVTTNPSSATICASSNASFSVTVSRATGYQWQQNTGSGFSNVSNGGVFSGATSTTLTITGATAGMNGYTYRCVAAGTCTPSANSSAATLTVSAAPVITQNPFPNTVCEGDAFLCYIAASNATSYQWQVNTGSGYTNVSNGTGPTGGIYSGATSSVLIINSSTVAMNGYTYRCIAAGTCSPNATSTGSVSTISANVTYYEDFDNDGYGNPNVTTSSCSGAPGGFVANSSDCDDNDANVFPGQSVWNGTTNTLWSEPSNWSCGALPDSTSNVTINSGSNMPVVDLTTAACNNLTINNGASLTINSGMSLNIKGNAINNGSFAAIGKTTFSGAEQTLPGGSFVDLEIAGTGNKSLGGEATVSGILTLTSSNLQLGNYNLTIGDTGSITGESASQYIVINGTGALKQQGIGIGGRTGAVNFPVGSASSYTPLSMTNAGTSDEFGVRVINNVFDTYNSSDTPTGTPQTDNNVDKTWTVTETVPGGSDVTLMFQWNASDELPSFDRNACFPSHYNGSYWQNSGLRPASGSNPYQTSLSGVTTFSPFGIGSGNSVLPLTLLTFTGKESTEGISLQWTTAHEVNTTGFDIERSANGGAFGIVASVLSKTSGGYTYLDKNVSTGSSYTYRLKMKDKDGKYTYSVSIAVAFGTKTVTGYSVFPNPIVGSYLYVKPLPGNKTDIQVDVVDLTGRMRFGKKLSSNNLIGGHFEIPVNQLRGGSYILRISDKNGERLQVTKFTVQD